MKSKGRSESKEKEIIRNIIKTRNTIRKKFQAIKTGRVETEAQLEEAFKPLTNPLKEFVTKVKQEPKHEIKFEPKEEYHDYDTLKTTFPKMESASTPLKYKELSLMSEDEFTTPTQPRTLSKRADEPLNLSTGLADRYFQLYVEKNPKIDYTYGLYFDNNEWKIGDSKVEYNEDNFVIKRKPYKITLGLLELLFMKKPAKSLYTEADLSNYKAILDDTNAHRRGYSMEEQIKGSRGSKYKHIISKLLNHKGMGLMHLPKNNIDHIYWNDPNELVDRLRLLIASQQAGNNSHHNEIISIIEELKEANIIE